MTNPCYKHPAFDTIGQHHGPHLGQRQELGRDHYSEVIETEITKLTTFTNPDWEQPFHIAANWARRHLGRRLLPETVERAEAVLITRLSEEDTAPTRAPDLRAETLSTKRNQQGPLTLPPSPPCSPFRNQLTATAQVHTRPASSTDMDRSPPTVPPASQSVDLQSKHTVATMTDMRGDWSLSPSSELEAQPPPLLPESPVLSGRLETNPKEQRPKRTTMAKPTATMPPSSLRGTSPSPERSTPAHFTEDPLPPTTSTPQDNRPGSPTSPGNQNSRRTPLSASPSSVIRDLDEDDLISLLEECQELTGTAGTTKAPLLTHGPVPN